MKEFNKLCKEFEEMDAGTYNTVLDELSARIIPALELITADGIKGELIFARFLMGAIVSDGKLSASEYLFMEPMLKRFFGGTVDFDYCKTLIKENRTMGKELKNEVDYMVDAIIASVEEMKAARG